MNPAAYRAGLIARAKSLAVPVASCVAGSLPPAHLLESLSRDEMAALIVVLAEAADPTRLRVVVEASDDGRPEVGQQELMLRRAHREFSRIRREGGEPTARLARLERAYQAGAKRRQRERQEAEAAAIASASGQRRETAA
jgi:hypothetical protein